MHARRAVVSEEMQGLNVVEEHLKDRNEVAKV